ncbi:hypothetical protein [Fusobacterium gonidiaformans]|nr:hypothetical protein [Fusobacterium gonidiaformans]EFS28404.2 hypothetical protein FGAG_00725 [Fusobacterium gonidiaformans ATCC 25563]
MIPEKWMIKSQDTYGKNLEVVNLKEFQQNGVYSYYYDSRLGECELVFFEKENRISLLRKGKNELHLNLQVGRTFEMKYQAEGYQDTFFVRALSCKREEGIFEFSYDILEENGERINQIVIQMKRRKSR